MEKQHSPLPHLSVGVPDFDRKNGATIEAGEYSIAECYAYNPKQTLKPIMSSKDVATSLVRAANTHSQLVEALEVADGFLEQIDMAFTVDQTEEVRNEIKAALAAAKGGQT